MELSKYLKKSYNLLIVAFVILYLTVFTGCEKDNNSRNNSNFKDTISHISVDDPEDAIVRIRFLFEYIPYQWAVHWNITGIMSGENEDVWGEFLSMKFFEHDASMSILFSIWEDYYESINLANLFLNEIPQSEELLSYPDIDFYKGQALFYRAVSYLFLVRFWGKFYPDKDLSAPGVPILKINSLNEPTRATCQEIYELIINDLDSASVLLPLQNDEGIVNKYAAIAFAAITHMWFQNYDNAEPLLNEIIESWEFMLLEEFKYNFDGLHENSDEAVFELEYDWQGEISYGGPGFIPSQRYSSFLITETPRYYLTEKSVEKFGNDPRAINTYFSPGEQLYIDDSYISFANNNPYHKKYAEVGIPSSEITGINLCILRYAEILLLYSEIQLNKGNNVEALQYLNMVRQRVGAPLISNSSSDELLDAIKQEYFLELYFEGKYWFNLIRWDDAQYVLSDRGFIKGINEALPIPTKIIENNENILQNDGY